MLSPVTLRGPQVRLEPLTLEHVDGLSSVGLDGTIWEYTPRVVRTRQDMQEYVSEALDGQRRGHMLPFAIVLQETGVVAGSTRFGNIDLTNRRMEIGWTWLAPAWQRTGVNREAKYLLLTQAFEEWECIRVEFKTDVLNSRSRRALLGIGAVEEGVLRRHVVVAEGRVRDTVYYSILDTEWPAVKLRLEAGQVR